jgi:hypothetical protein
MRRREEGINVIREEETNAKKRYQIRPKTPK